MMREMTDGPATATAAPRVRVPARASTRSMAVVTLSGSLICLSATAPGGNGSTA